MKTSQHSKRVWLAAVGMACVIASHAVEVLTLGGGPTQAKPGRAGFANGPTLEFAKFNQPFGIAILPDGSLIIADKNNNKLRVISSPGNDAASVTTTFAQRVPRPCGVAVHPLGLVFSANEREGSVRRYNLDGTVEVFRGFVRPTAIAVDLMTNVFVAELRGTIWKLAPDGTVTQVTSGFNQPRGLALLKNGLLAVSESRGHAIYTVNLDNGSFTVLAGTAGVAGFADGATNVARFNSPHGITVAPNGMLVVADRLNHRIRLVETNGVVSTLYGQSQSAFSRPFPGWREGDETEAQGRDPVGVAVGTNGTLYVTELYWNIIRQVTGANLASRDTNAPGTTNGVITVPVPTFSPTFGYFPMGTTITVTSTVPVFYTTDGTEPTLNSRQVQLVDNVGTIRFTENLRDLTALRLRAFIGTNASEVVGGQGSPVNEIGVPRDVTAGSGSQIVVPIVVNLRPNDQIKSIQFRVEVTPLNGAPPVLPQFRAISVSSNDFIPVATASAPNTVGRYNAVPYSIGPTRGLVVSAIGTNANFEVKRFAVAAMLVLPIDPNTFSGHTYRIETLYPSATSDGLQTPVPIAPMAAKTITVGSLPWLVGDSSPGSWYNAGDFGDDDLQNDDVNNVFYASHGVRVPFPYTDVWNAMNAYPPEERGGQGDSDIDSFDLNLVLDRALRRNPNNWVRRWLDGGIIDSQPAGLPAPASANAATKSVNTPPGPGTVWLREVTVGAGSLTQVIPGEPYEVPIWVKVAPGSSLSGLSIRAAVVPDDTAPAFGTVSFTPLLGAGNFIGANGVAPNEVLCSWLMVPSPAFAPSLRGSNVVGRLRFQVPYNASPGQSYTIHFLKLSGGADMETPYHFEGVRGSLWVQCDAQRAPEITSDEWKQHFFGSIDNLNADASLDVDEDGASNAQEYREGTSPIDAASKLRLTQTDVQTQGGPAVRLSWLSASARAYVLERGAGVNGPWTVLGSGMVGDGYEQEFIDSAPSGSAPFYRIRVQ